MTANATTDQPDLELMTEFLAVANVGLPPPGPFVTCVNAGGNGDGTTEVLWRIKGSVEECVVAIYGDRLLVGASDGCLYAIR
ncbi:MAG TPA: hypothetical protein QGH10_27350 [Armatimonadota bacterium]|nr:hypothetical protein [Armatimonadota bacterium]